MFWPFIEFLTGGQILFGMYMASMMALNGEISIGTYVAFIGLLAATMWPVQGIGRLVAHVSTGLVSLNRVQEIIRQEREQLEEGTAPTNKRLRGALQFRNVQFAYETPAAEESKEAKKGKGAIKDLQETRRRAFAERGYVLRDINFDVQPGQVIGLLGATGSGKSSLVNLLPRFYDYSGGNITLDGEELRAYARGFLRSQIGIVQQEPFLFSTTIRNNITYGLGRDVSEEEMEAAARAAAIHDVGSGLPQGLRYAGRRAGRDPLRRTEAARDYRTHFVEGPGHPVAGRRHLQRGHGNRRNHPRGAEPADARADDFHHRPSCAERDDGRPDPGDGSRADYPAGQSQRTGLPAGRLPPSISNCRSRSRPIWNGKLPRSSKRQR